MNILSSQPFLLAFFLPQNYVSEGRWILSSLEKGQEDSYRNLQCDYCQEPWMWLILYCGNQSKWVYVWQVTCSILSFCVPKQITSLIFMFSGYKTHSIAVFIVGYSGCPVIPELGRFGQEVATSSRPVWATDWEPRLQSGTLSQKKQTDNNDIWNCDVLVIKWNEESMVFRTMSTKC